MKKLSAGVLLTVTILLTYSNIYSQAIKVDFLGYNGIVDGYEKQMFYGFGYDHNLGDKISIGLTYKSGYSLDESFYSEGVGYSFSSVDGLVYFQVLQGIEWHEFAFTSKYFFSDNEDGSYFVSSGISLLKSKNEYYVNSLSVGGIGQESYGDISTGTYQQDVTLIPLSLDLGHRGEFDGLYFEIYSGVAFTPFGANPDAEPAFLKTYGVETKFNPVSFHICLSFGFSWAD